jgi:DNA-binding transcriptional ArsR family regulator
MRRQIGDILVEKGLITVEQLQAAVEEQQRTGKLLGEVLIDHGAIDRLALAGALGAQWNPVVRERAEQKLEEHGLVRVDRAGELEELRNLIVDLQVKVARLEASLDERDQKLALVTKLVLDSAA